MRQRHGLGLLGVEDAVVGWEAEQDASSQDFRSPAVTAVTRSETCPSDWRCRWQRRWGVVLVDLESLGGQRLRWKRQRA